MERRTLPTEFEIRSAGQEHYVVGYAYKFDTRSQNLGGFKETIRPGAGKDSVASDDIFGLNNHDTNQIIGRTSSGTLKLAEDTVGLHYEIHADRNISYVNDLIISMERGDVRHSSFAFDALEDEWSRDADDTPLREVRKMRIFDVSPVSNPAYLEADSTIARRSLSAFLRSDPVAGRWVAPFRPSTPADPILARHTLRT